MAVPGVGLAASVGTRLARDEPKNPGNTGMSCNGQDGTCVLLKYAGTTQSIGQFV
jgi:hypothetical protein